MEEEVGHPLIKSFLSPLKEGFSLSFFLHIRTLKLSLSFLTIVYLEDDLEKPCQTDA